ncbi:nucleophile aminohydrolase [Pisolithus marmoratus]|nr:nucleophile aminohydrolase [Pisolithus marmoratus]
MYYRGSGFDFSNSLRNDFLQHKGVVLPKATSTGTTIVGCVFKDGIILGADTRATGGDIVADKNCEKIHYISESIRCCGAGTAADTEFVTASISSNIELHALSTGRKPRVVAAMTLLKQYLFQYQGQVGAALVLGGVDSTGAHLFTVHPHGSTDKLPYVTMGSGSLAADGRVRKWMETQHGDDDVRPAVQREEALKLVCDAVAAGIFNDLGSGSNIDACVITATHTEMLRNFVTPNERVAKEMKYGFRRGTTAVKSEHIRSLVTSEEITPTRGEAMDVS